VLRRDIKVFHFCASCECVTVTVIVWGKNNVEYLVFIFAQNMAFRAAPWPSVNGLNYAKITTPDTMLFQALTV
jgi:hypothetical protein